MRGAAPSGTVPYTLSPFRASPVFRDCPELLDRLLRSLALFGVDQAVIDMIVDQCPLGACDGILNRLELLRQFDTGAVFIDHTDDAAEVTGCPVQAFDDGRVTVVRVAHVPLLAEHSTNCIPPGGLTRNPPGG
ncbi:conserved hypothetical protein [Sphingomonas aurantiaca]|uniref:Uncharacterized protein n=1 Tax=Sphingomonas aurantiaca TaxID=185949 RepID=A0A5E8A8S6_9SPHN|nr:conserved hypothetical protein [Sphingomonas aurantiaca]